MALLNILDKNKLTKILVAGKNEQEDKSIWTKGWYFSIGFCFQWYISIRIPKVCGTGKSPFLKEPSTCQQALPSIHDKKGINKILSGC